MNKLLAILLVTGMFLWFLVKEILTSITKIAIYFLGFFAVPWIILFSFFATTNEIKLGFRKIMYLYSFIILPLAAITAWAVFHWLLTKG